VENCFEHTFGKAGSAFQNLRLGSIKMSKINRLVEPMVWEYFRDRGRTSIQEIYNKFKEKGLNKLKIIFFCEPKI
jgi:hypothetical protein